MSWRVPLPFITRKWLALQFNTSRLRQLMPNREHVTWREPTVTSRNLAISSRELPSATQSLIFWTFTGLNFVARRPTWEGVPHLLRWRNIFVLAFTDNSI